MAGHNYPREELVLAGSRQWQQSPPADWAVSAASADIKMRRETRASSQELCLLLAKYRQIGTESKDWLPDPVLSSSLTECVLFYNQHFQPSLCGTRYTWTWYRGAKRFWQFLIEDYKSVIFLLNYAWLVISQDFDTVLLGEAPVPRARVLGSIVEISTPNSSLEISSIDQTRMAVTEQTRAFSCNLREILKILKKK